MKRITGFRLAITAVLVAGAFSPLNALAANKFIVMDTSGAVPQFVVTDTGWTGVGNNAPAAALHISGAVKGNASQIKAFNTDATGGTSGGGGLFFGHNNGPAGTLNNLPKKNDRLGYMNAGTIDDQQPGVNMFGGGLQFTAAADWTIDRPSNAQHFPTYLRFQTADTSGSSTARMVIYPNGSVYVGPNFNLATPPSVSQKLEVDGGARLIPQAGGSQPACVPALIGTFWYTQTPEALQVCTSTGWKTVTLF
jgi:hypothetical protein